VESKFKKKKRERLELEGQLMKRIGSRRCRETEKVIKG
jgi:hypothetical protein